jgi:hypothetical protein
VQQSPRTRSLAVLATAFAITTAAASAHADEPAPASPAPAPPPYPETVPQGYDAAPREPATAQPGLATAPQDAEPAPYPQTAPQGYGDEPQPFVYSGPRPSMADAGMNGNDGCCRWSVRYDPFDLLTRRVTVAAEVALGNLPISLEFTPKYVFGSTAAELDEKGFDLGANVAWYPGGRALRGVWVKAHVEYEKFRATLTRDGGSGAYGKPDPSLCDASSAPGTCSRSIGSTIVGLMVGSTQVFGGQGGFAISGGFGIGAALADPQKLGVLPCTASDLAAKDPSCSAAEPGGAAGIGFTYYDNTSRIRLLGSLGLGVVF